MEIRFRWRLYPLAVLTVRIPKFRVSRAKSCFRPADPAERNGRVRSLGMAALVVSWPVAGRTLGQARLASRLGETGGDSGGDRCDCFPGATLRATGRGPHIR